MLPPHAATCDAGGVGPTRHAANCGYVHLTYVSSATQEFSGDELARLLALSRVNNERVGVTGMLLYKDGNFMQVIEGSQDAVMTLKRHIERDGRHKGLLVLVAEERAERAFSEWSMAFRNLNEPSVNALPGFDEFLNTSLKDERFTRSPIASQKLLAIFKRNLSR